MVQRPPAEDDSESRWYTQTLFDYTNKLLDRTEQRANFMLVSNSVLGASYFSILSFFSDKDNTLIARITGGAAQGQMSQLDSIAFGIAFLPAFAISISILLSVHTILPIILRHDIKLNHGFIAKMSPEEYRRYLAARPKKRLREDFVDEIQVLSCILSIKSKRVERAARAFVLAMATIPIALIFYVIGLI